MPVPNIPTISSKQPVPPSIRPASGCGVEQRSMGAWQMWKQLLAKCAKITCKWPAKMTRLDHGHGRRLICIRELAGSAAIPPSFIRQTVIQSFRQSVIQSFRPSVILLVSQQVNRIILRFYFCPEASTASEFHLHLHPLDFPLEASSFFGYRLQFGCLVTVLSAR